MWDRCWSIARVHLKLSDDEFYSLTPRQYHLLVDQHHSQIDHYDFLAGVIASTIANWSYHAPKKALTPSDFVPSRHGKSTAEKPARINRKKIADNVRAFLEARMPKDKP